MVYVITKPDSGPSPNLDAPNIQGNFAAFNTSFSTNHVAMNSDAQGDHTNVIFQRQTSTPDNPINGDILFSENVTSKLGTQPGLLVRIPVFLPTKLDPTTGINNSAMVLTFNQVNTIGPNQYQSFLIGIVSPYLIYFGSISGNTTPSVIINTQITLSPAPQEILLAIATANTNVSAGTQRPFDVRTRIDSTDKFTISSAANDSSGSIAYSIGWVAIAKA